MVSKGIDDVNKTRQNKVLSGFLKVLEESISTYRPQTHKNSNRPHISFIMRKPEDLGTELKVVADTKSNILLYLEIQQGKSAMEGATHAYELSEQLQLMY